MNPVLIVLFCLLILILLIAWVRLHPFLSFIIVSLLAGWWLGLPGEKITTALKTGMGNMMGELMIVVCCGAMLGKLIADSGAAQKISDTIVRWVGEKNVQWAMMLTGFVAGIPLFYNVGFVLLIPLVFAVIYRTGLPAVATALPMLAALSVTHGFLPPHPSPLAVGAQLHADAGKVLLYGIAVAIPAILVAGPLFSKTLKKLKTNSIELFKPADISVEKTPGTFSSFICALLPALLLIIFSAVQYLPGANENIKKATAIAGDPVIILLVSLLTAAIVLGIQSGLSVKRIMNICSDAVKEIAVILLIIAGAGALKQVMTESGVSDTLGNHLGSLNLNPLILGWLIAAVIRVCLGSATVAGLTAAGIIAPLVHSSGVNPELMVLSVGAGSLMFSHVNDSGFWMFKEYFNLSVKDTIRSWSVMESIVSVMGLLGVLLLQMMID